MSFKAHKGGKMLMVVPCAVGQTQFVDDISDSEIRLGLEYLKSVSSGLESNGVGGIDMSAARVTYSGTVIGRFFEFEKLEDVVKFDIEGVTPVLIGVSLDDSLSGENY